MVDLVTATASCHRPCKIMKDYTEAGQELNNQPEEWNQQNVYATRYVIWYNPYHVEVILYESYPKEGRIWTNFYNMSESWRGWVPNI